MMSRERGKAMNGLRFALSITISGAILLTMGCGNPNEDLGLEADAVLMPPSDDVHSHASEGPHRGTLIELGDEEYHAELIHGDEQLTCYVLDSSATKSVAIDSPSIALNLVVDGKTEQLKLVANPDIDDPAGRSSRFQVVNNDAAIAIDKEGTIARLSLTIAGTAYIGEVQHDHAGHLH